MIQIKNLSKSFATQLIFDDVSLSMSCGEKLGFVGRNGSGKSTLFSMISGEQGFESGSIIKPKNYRIGVLPQYIKFTYNTLLKECTSVLSGDKEFEEFRVEKILMGLGFTQEDFAKDPMHFSGGYQLRINLTKLLVQDFNLILLDEPSNYLDITSIRWLQDFLRSYKGEFILITHDRYFMDSVVTHVAGINRKKIKKVQGNTQKLYDQWAEEDEIHEKTMLNIEAKRKNLEQFVTRFKAQANKASQAQSKIKQIAKLPIMEKMTNERLMSFSFNHHSINSKDFLSATDLCFSYEATNPLIKDFNYKIFNGDRIAIIGKNGKGKSTLLNLLAGVLQSQNGEIKKANELRIGHFGQTNITNLTSTNTIIEEIQSANEDLGGREIRSICGAMAFEGDLAEKKISVLSGGEKSRVLLGKLLAKKTNLLLLDEPTNHLDMESIEIIMNQLESYEGSVIIVSHNEGIIRDFAKRLIVFQNNEILCFEGNYDYFLNKIGWIDEENEKNNKKKGSRQESKQRRSEIIKERSKVLKPLKDKIDFLENEIFKLEEDLKFYNDDIIKASETSDAQKIKILSMNIDIAHKKIERNFNELTEIMPEYETLEKKYQNLLEEDES